MEKDELLDFDIYLFDDIGNQINQFYAAPVEFHSHLSTIGNIIRSIKWGKYQW
jgi:hypothetical protein